MSAADRNSYRAARRDAPVNCPSCGREVQRRARQQRFCSRRCRQKANYGEKVARGDFSTRTIARPTNPSKKDNKFKALQWAKSLSSHRILAPARVLDAEVFGRAWQPATSSSGVAIETSRLRARALVPP
jgi:ribosomal protein L37AE/L43A